MRHQVLSQPVSVSLYPRLDRADPAEECDQRGDALDCLLRSKVSLTAWPTHASCIVNRDRDNAVCWYLQANRPFPLLSFDHEWDDIGRLRLDRRWTALVALERLCEILEQL